MKETKKTPAISVVMAVFNGAQWLHEAIKSVLDQTFTDFEFIIVDDGSTDDSSEIIQKYATQDSRIVVVTKDNSGLAESLNVGLQKARGYWIARMDADDICKPDRFKKQVSYLNDHPEIVLVSGAVEYIDERGNVFGRTYPIISIKRIRHKILNYGNIIVHPAVMMRRDIVIFCGGYFPGLTTVEDLHLWRKFLRNNYDLSILPDVLISYRISGFAISNRKKTDYLNHLIKDILEYDSPPQDLIDAFRQEVEMNKCNFSSFELRKADIEKTMHCRLWRFCKMMQIPDKFSQYVICSINNIINR